MRTSEAINEISAALAKAQGSMENPLKTKTATIPTKTGGSYSYNYADLPTTYDTIRKQLYDNGLAHFSGLQVREGKKYLVMRLSHSSGQWIESEVDLPPPVPKKVGEAPVEDPQEYAADITFYKRYLFSGLVGISGDEDTDGAPKAEAKYKPKLVTDSQLLRLKAIVRTRKWHDTEVSQLIHKMHGLDQAKEMDMNQYNDLVMFIEKNGPESIKVFDGPQN